MKKYLKYAILLLVCFVTIPFSVKATDVTEWSSTNSLPSSSGKYKLTSNVEISAIYDLTGQDITIDLNGHNIVSKDAIKVIGGSKLTIDDSSSNQSGFIKSLKDPAIIVDNGILTMNAGTLQIGADWAFVVKLYGSQTLDATDYSVFNFGEKAKIVNVGTGYSYGIGIVPTPTGKKDSNDNAIYHSVANGVVVNLAGKFDLRLNQTPTKFQGNHGLYINGQIKNTKGNVPVFNLEKTFEINNVLNDTTYEGDIIYAAGYAKWNIKGGNYIAKDGLSIKSGEFNIEGGKFTTYGDKKVPVANNNGAESTGAAISITSNSGYAEPIIINIKGGEFISQNSFALFEGITKGTSTHVKTLNITGGTFTSAADTESLKIENMDTITNFSITGGEYSSNPTTYKAKDYVVVTNEGSTGYLIANNYNKETGEDLVLTFDGNADDFRELKIAGQVVDTKYYSVASGSTIVTLKNEYLKTLDDNTYEVTVVYNDDTELTKTLNIVTSIPNPQTFDGIQTYIVLGIIALIGFLVSGLMLRNKIKTSN